MKSNPYKIDDAEEFEPTLASQVRNLEIYEKPHSDDPVFAQELEGNREILLLRVPRWLQCFIYKYWFSCVSLRYLLTLTPPFVMG